MLTVINRTKLSWQRVTASSSFANHIILTMGTNLILAVIALVTGPLAARLLGPYGRGELAAIQTWPSFITAFALLGLPEAIVYFSARHPSQISQYLASAMILALLATLPFLTVGYFLMPLLLAAQSTQVVTAARWYLLLIPVQATQGMLFSALRGRNNLLVWNALRVSPSLCWLALLVLASFFEVVSPEWLAGHYLLLLGLLFFPVFVVVRRRVPGPFWPELRVWKPMLSYGLPLAVAAIPQLLNLRLDQMLMIALLPPGLLGLYAVAVAWSAVTLPLLRAVGVVVFPHIAAQSSFPEQIQMFARGVRLGNVLAIGLSLPLLIVTPTVVPWLFGPSFTPAVPAAMILIVAGGIDGAKAILQEGFRGIGRPKVVLYSESIGLAITVLALTLFLQPLEIVGAALASLLGYTATVVFLVFKISRISRHSVLWYLWPQRGEFSLLYRRVLMMIKVMSSDPARNSL